MAAKVRVPCARALYGFQGQSSYELNFSAGVSIMLLRRIDQNWLEGQLEGKVGIFPSSHVKIEVGSPSVSRENVLASSGKPYAVALHTFQGTQEGDLSFSKGDLIELLGEVPRDGQGWINGKLDSIIGTFPASFVEILRYPEKVVVESNRMVESNRGEDSVKEGGTVSPPERPRPIPKPRHRHQSNPTTTTENETQTPSLATPSNLTPSRSAPAPPTVGPSPSSQQGVKYPTLPKPVTPSQQPPTRSHGTLPKPKPRKLPRTTSSSSRLDILESELAIERKLLESAESLFLADNHRQTKNERRSRAISTHKSNISLLEAAIVEVKESEEERGVPPPSHAPPPLPPPPRPALPVSSKEQQRTKVIDELIFTERDFHHQMDLCSSKVLPALREVQDIQADMLFGNIEEITALSGDFLKSLEETCEGNKLAPVGGIFMTFAPRLKSVYATYCRHHDTAAAHYEKCMENTVIAESIHHSMDMLRGEIQAWDLQSLLIKPVQRMLKYPLLLDRLVGSTPETHPDYKVVHNAREAIAKVAQDINEIKRGKDLVVKYTVSKEDKRGSLTVHSLQKKMRRFQQTLTQFTGLRSKTIDPEFDEIEQKVVSLDSLIRTLIKDIASWQDQLHHVVESRVTLLEGMHLYCPGSRPLSNFRTLMSQLQQALKSQAKFVRTHVTIPLETLVGLFQNPLHLIQKRKDKLLDYDHMQYALDHAEDSEKIAQLREELLLAKRNYEALNVKLLEELPSFIESVVKMLQHQLTVLVQAQYTFYSSVAALYPPLLPSSQLSTGPEIQQEHAEQLVAICKDLTKLSLVPASFSMNFRTASAMNKTSTSSATGVLENSSPSDTGIFEEEESVEVGESSSPSDIGVFEVESSTPVEVEENSTSTYSATRLSKVEENNEGEECVILPEGTPEKGARLQVLYSFVGLDPAELSVSVGDSVVLLCPHDKLGCREWWLVQCQDTQGYVPASYLTECDGNR